MVRWPFRSPTRPTPSSSALTTSRYAVTTHSIDATDAPIDREMTGSMVFTTLASSADMSVPIPTAPSTHHLRSTSATPHLARVCITPARRCEPDARREPDDQLDAARALLHLLP